MGYHYRDLVDNASAFGLEYLGRIELDNQAWSFNYLGVMQDTETKKFFIIRDSGCSCPSPWENHTSRADLDSGPLTAHEAVKIIQNAVDSRRLEALDSYYKEQPDDPSDLIATIMRRN